MIPLGPPTRRRGRAMLYCASVDIGEVVVKAAPAAGQEALMLCRVRHPSIVRCLSIGRLNDRTPAFMMPRAETDLEEALAREGPFPPDRVAGLMRRLADALAAVHAAGLRHGDVALANVLLTAHGPQLADFEHAGPIADAAPASRPGTFDFMAPEALDGLPLDARADIYGLGAVGWAMLAGRPPGPFERPPAASGGLRRFLERCLSPDRAKRPADGAEAGRLLREAV